MNNRKEGVRTYFTRRVKLYLHVVLSVWCQAGFDFVS